MKSIQKRKGVPLKRRGALNSGGRGLILIVALLLSWDFPLAGAEEEKVFPKSNAPLPTGFITYSKGRKGDRTLHKVTLNPGMTEAQVRASETHEFHNYDVYVVRLDGKLPAIPVRVGHGYYHYGSSADMKWFITKFTGHARNQNKGGEVMLCTLAATPTSFNIQHRMLVADDGSWVDVHSNG